MKTQDRIDELDRVWARLTLGSLRVDDRSLLQELINKESGRLKKLVSVSKASKLKRQLAKEGKPDPLNLAGLESPEMEHWETDLRINPHADPFGPKT